MQLDMENKVVLVFSLLVMVFGLFIRFYSENYGYFAFTTSPSLKYTFFYVNVKRKEPRVGDYVAFWLEPDKIIKERQKSLKEVVCGPGDVLEVKGKDYYCNGRYLGRAKDRSLKGVPVDNFRWNGVIPQEHYFVMGSHRDSYDSRYYGFVKKEKILGIAKPLL